MDCPFETNLHQTEATDMWYVFILDMITVKPIMLVTP